MTSKEIMTRRYHDEEGDHIPVYRLYRHSPDFFDTDCRTQYTVVAVYDDKSVSNWLFTDLRQAFRAFRRMVGLDII